MFPLVIQMQFYFVSLLLQVITVHYGMANESRY